MGKAVFGSVVDQTSYRLLEEVRALRGRVARLEAALAEAEAALAARGDGVTVDEIIEIDAAHAVTA